MTGFQWDDPAFMSGGKIEWYEGMEIVGTVTMLGKHTWPAKDDSPERTVPQLQVDELVITCNPADLRKKVIAARPQVGDRIKIECVSSTKTQVGTQYFFTVKVQKTNPTAINNPKAETSSVITDAVAEDPIPF